MSDTLFLFVCGFAAGVPAGICIGTVLYGKYSDAIDRWLDRIL